MKLYTFKKNQIMSSVGEDGSRSWVVAVLLTGRSTGAGRQSMAQRAASLIWIDGAAAEPHLKSVGALSGKPLQKGCFGVV